MEASAVKQLLEEGVDEGEEVGLLHAAHPPIMIRGEDGVLYQVRTGVVAKWSLWTRRSQSHEENKSDHVLFS